MLLYRCCTGRCLMVVSCHLITCLPSSTVSPAFSVTVSWSRCSRTASQCHLSALLPQLCMRLYARVSAAILYILLLVVVQCVQKKRDQNVFVVSSTKLQRFWWNLVASFLSKFSRVDFLCYGGATSSKAYYGYSAEALRLERITLHSLGPGSLQLELLLGFT